MFAGGAWVALVTPMHQDCAIDFESLTMLLEQHVNTGVQGIVLLGTTAESPTLTFGEKSKLLQHTCAILDGRLQIVVGVSCNNLHDAETWMAECEGHAIDGYMIVTPYYNKPTMSGLIAYYQHCLTLTHRPVIAYNVPSRTGCDITNDALEILSRHSNFLGLKDATGDLARVWRCRQQFPNMLLLSGDDATFLPFMKLGGNGVISVAANIFPQVIAQICKHAMDGQWHTAMAQDHHLQSFYTALASSTNPIPCKQMLSVKYSNMFNTVRLPLVADGKKEMWANVYKQALIQCIDVDHASVET